MPRVKTSPAVHFLLFGSLVFSTARAVPQIENSVHFVHYLSRCVVIAFEVVDFVLCVWMEETWVT